MPCPLPRVAACIDPKQHAQFWCWARALRMCVKRGLVRKTRAPRALSKNWTAGGCKIRPSEFFAVCVSCLFFCLQTRPKKQNRKRKPPGSGRQSTIRGTDPPREGCRLLRLHTAHTAHAFCPTHRHTQASRAPRNANKVPFNCPHPAAQAGCPPPRGPRRLPDLKNEPWPPTRLPRRSGRSDVPTRASGITRGPSVDHRKGQRRLWRPPDPFHR